MPNFPKSYADRVAKLRVPFGFVLVAAFAWFSRPTVESLLIGLPVSAAGLALRAWAAGHLAKNSQLARSGPYASVRNPLYLGTLLVAAGLVAASRSIGLGILFAAVFGLIYLPVIQLEEQHLRSLFPEFAAYAREVPALLPRFRASTGTVFQPTAVPQEPGIRSPAGFPGGVGRAAMEGRLSALTAEVGQPRQTRRVCRAGIGLPWTGVTAKGARCYESNFSGQVPLPGHDDRCCEKAVGGRMGNDGIAYPSPANEDRGVQQSGYGSGDPTLAVQNSEGEGRDDQRRCRESCRAQALKIGPR